MHTDSHIHMVLDGIDWRKAIARHATGRMKIISAAF